MFQDPRAEKYENLQLDSIKRVPVGDDLMRHLTYGGVMHPSEAIARIEVMRVMGEQNAIYGKSIRRHQKRLGISSLNWKEISYCGYSCQVPTISEFLSPTKQDVRVIRENTGEIIRFLRDVAKYFKVWLYSDRLSRQGKYCWKQIQWDAAENQLNLCDWVDLHHLDAIVRCLSADGEFHDEPENYFSISGYDSPPTAVREPCVWIQLNNDRPSL